MNTQTIPVAVMVQALRQAKAAEAAATAHRQSIEAQIIARFPVPQGGEGTHKDEEFSIAFKVTRKVDTEAVQVAWNDLHANAQKAFKWAATVDLKAYRALGEFDAPAFETISKFITTTPAKPAITLKETT